MPGVQYGSNTRFNFRLSKKKPPAKAVVCM